MSQKPVIRRLLIANRSEIARRVIRTAHRLGIQTVAVYSDADAGALHVREASSAQHLSGNASSDTYLRIDRILAAAKASGADAVHPGYGFLSENAAFAQAVQDAGLIWVGPPPAAITALGSKSNAKELAIAHGVPVLPGYQGADQSEARFCAEAAAIGFPLMVKATAGGGGRGMRLVTQAAHLPEALASARAEAMSGFGNGELLIERALLQPRHVEIQVFADAHGHCVHLGERDCSVQRRNQKIIEESPSPAVDAALRERMGSCAVALALAAGYLGAGTVEFLMQDGEFYLMEMNTRLQVEHPVTEMLTGFDLVEWQIRVANGEPLPVTQAQVVLQGHSIEVRLCAEDEHYQPHTGTVSHLAWPATHAAQSTHSTGACSALRIDHALEVGTVVSPHYDAMLGKLIVHAPTRAQAIDALHTALAQTQVLGLPTNRAFLMACLRRPDFCSGAALVPFLVGAAPGLCAQIEQAEQRLLPTALLALHGARASSCAPESDSGASVWGSTRLACGFPQSLRVLHRGAMVAHQIMGLGQGQVGFYADLGEGIECEAHLHVARGASATEVTVLMDGKRTVVSCAQTPSGAWHVQTQGVDLFLQDASFEPATQGGRAVASANTLAPFNGKVVGISVQAGQVVQRGDTLVVIESMKLQHNIGAQRDGVVASVNVELGQQVSPQQVLVVFEG